MSHADFAGRAGELLEAQLVQLGELRNANTRDHSFKQWRQATLTLLQRLWPGEPTRSEYFRRIPFTAPMSRPDARTSREYFERGCGEAASFLKALVSEVASVGVASNQTVTEREGLPPGTREDDFPTLNLPGGPDPGAAVPAPPCEAPALARATEPGSATGRHARSTRKSGSKARLKDMLGFGDMPATPAPAADRDPQRDEPQAKPDLPAKGPPPGEETGALERATEELLRTSPVLKSTARPVHRADPEVTLSPTPVSEALVALAAEIEDLGVPEADRARVRAALLDLARQIEACELTWVALREAVNFLMESPALGRRVLPLLVPFLDRAA